jgi:hypothetical protein
MVSLFAGSDEDIKSMYGSQHAIEATKAALEAALDQNDKLMKCKTMFQTVSTGDLSASVVAAPSNHAFLATALGGPALRVA